MKRFIGYRPHPPEEYQKQGAANPPDEPQYEGVVFSDGTVAVRWLTQYRSHSIWTDFNTFYQIHGHPEYGTRIDWLEPHCVTLQWKSDKECIVCGVSDCPDRDALHYHHDGCPAAHD